MIVPDGKTDVRGTSKKVGRGRVAGGGGEGGHPNPETCAPTLATWEGRAKVAGTVQTATKKVIKVWRIKSQA